MHCVDGKIVCEMMRKEGGSVISEFCDLGEDNGKVKRA